MEQYLNILNEFALLVDAGLVVLIWMVQLIIYPSFLYYKKENLIKWHQKYTLQIALLVVPLMAYQLVFGGFCVFYQFSLLHVIYLSTVLFLWAFTFLGFAPLHFKISEGNLEINLLQTLVKRNWIRTFLWTFLFLFHFFTF